MRNFNRSSNDAINIWAALASFEIKPLELWLSAMVLIGGAALHFPAIYYRWGLPIEVTLSLLSFATPISGMLWLSAAQVVPDPPIGAILSSSQWAIAGFLLWQLWARRINYLESSKPLLKVVAPFFVWVVMMNFVHGGGLSEPLLLIYAILTGCAAAILMRQSGGRLVLCLVVFLVGQMLASSVFWIINLHLGAPVQAFDVSLYGNSTMLGTRIGTARGNANMLGPPMALAVVGMFGLWLTAAQRRNNSKRKMKLIAVLGMAVVIGPLIGSGSRGAILAACCGILVLVLTVGLSSDRTALLNIIVVSGIALMVMAGAWNRFGLGAHWNEMKEREENQAAQAQQEGNASIVAGRSSVWGDAWGGILDSPIIGGGDVTITSAQYQNAPEMWAAHSTYLEAGLEGGFPGMAFFCYLVIKPLLALWPCRRNAAISFLGGVYAVSIISIGSTSALQMKHFWILWGIASACFALARPISGTRIIGSQRALTRRTPRHRPGLGMASLTTLL
jgi:O-antigen ligase